MRVILKLLFGLVILVVPGAHTGHGVVHTGHAAHQALEIAATEAGWPRQRSFVATLRVNRDDRRR